MKRWEGYDFMKDYKGIVHYGYFLSPGGTGSCGVCPTGCRSQGFQSTGPITASPLPIIFPSRGIIPSNVIRKPELALLEASSDEGANVP